WKRAIVFLASVPITVLMNSLRIGLIGITVEHWGNRMAEGLLHEFEGWVVFMMSTVVVLLIAMGLTRIRSSPARGAASAAVPSTAPASTMPVNSTAPAVPVVTAAGTPAAPFQTLPRSFVADAA